MAINPTPAPQKLRLRCAIYTRKSSEDGLEQNFNSLDAQYEACEAYITSQRQEGWVKIKARYDDGGLSGGTLERPALKALLADVAAGQVDMIVVYKIDRLTRSLADFAKLVDGGVRTMRTNLRNGLNPPPSQQAAGATQREQRCGSA